MTLPGAGRTSRPPVVACLPLHLDAFEDLKARCGIEGDAWLLDLEPRLKLLGDAEPFGERRQLCGRESLEMTQVSELGREIGGSLLKPVAMNVGPMHPERTSDGVTELPVAQFVLPGEDLDSVQLIEDPFDRNTQPERKIVL